MRSFITRFKEIVALSDGISDDIITYFFIKALSVSLREKVRSGKPATLKAAFEIAVEKERVVSSKESTVQPVPKEKKNSMEDEITNLTK